MVGWGALEKCSGCKIHVLLHTGLGVRFIVEILSSYATVSSKPQVHAFSVTQSELLMSAFVVGTF